MLTSDMFNRSSSIKFYYRNWLILATILLRYKNKEERSNVEQTPEEVLLVRKGLNQEMVKVVLDFLEKNQEYVIQKVRNITRILFSSSARESQKDGEMQPRFLLYLLRELAIFLALIGSDSSQAIIYGLVKEFGNPDSSYYLDMKDKENLRYSLLLLQVATRALKRFNDPQSDVIFDEIAKKRDSFVNLFKDPDHLLNVERVLARINNNF